jgi:Fe-S oxidoreductase
MTKRKNGYHRIFIEANGPGPWPCYGCDELVTKLLIHHLDKDASNNDPNNLVAMHSPCHHRLHQLGRKHSDESRQKMSETRLGKKLSPEHSRRIGEGHRGKIISAEHRAALRAFRLGRPMVQRLFKCGDCDLITIGSALHPHQKATGHQGKTEVGTT